MATIAVNDKEYKGGTLTDGEFKFYSFDKVKAVTDVVTIKALDKDGNSNKIIKSKTVIPVYGSPLYFISVCGALTRWKKLFMMGNIEI
ncbi:hypothetical protein HCJ66_09950 [Listeria sp. FSL L7-1582]|uniref:immunoglobulin-like domain-containing protein n=1 Tax=Listeria portnoyi TaxID=2713504 RepID=UPI00164D10D9|nr:immunoglobulin-like domain-containing protein [Listeria portnoyi]MBC6309863.1 hypothetical protein [Listeria portnoyi]